MIASVPEQGQDDAGGSEPSRRREQEGLHVVVGDVRRPVQGGCRVGEHDGLGGGGGGFVACRGPESPPGEEKNER